MKKTILAGMAMLTLSQAASPLVFESPTGISHVQAAEDLNFDKGDQSEEEYIKSVIDQLLKQDALNIEMQTGDQEPNQIIIDITNKSMKLANPLTSTSEEKSESIFYDDGTYIEPVSSSLSFVELANMENAEASQIIKDIGKELEGKSVLKKDEGIEGYVTSAIDEYKKLSENLANFEEKDGKVIGTTEDMDLTNVPNPDMLTQIYGDDVTMNKEVTVDPEEQTVTVVHRINGETEEENSESEESMGDQFTPPSEITYVLKTSDESIPQADEIETLSEEEFNKIIEEKGLKPSDELQEQ